MDKRLSQRTIDIVKSTAPVLSEHGLAITKCFYSNLLTERADIRPHFNLANQSVGEKKTRLSQVESFSAQFFQKFEGPHSQAMALAQTIHAYALNIDNLKALGPTVELIAHKHCSLGVLPEHYPVIGSYLLRAIKEVLGDAATPEVLDAWREAYEFLAEIFIDVESKLRTETAKQSGGWAFTRKFIVDRKEVDNEDTVSLYMKPVDGGELPLYRPGQYSGFCLDIPGVGRQYRNYTLSGHPNPEHLRVTVKREPSAGGYEPGLVSNHLHDTVKKGDVVEMLPPHGPVYFVPTTRPVVIVGAGIGVTAAFAILSGLANSQQAHKVTFIQCVRNGQSHPMRAEVLKMTKQCGATYVTVYSQPLPSDQQGRDYDLQGRLTLDRLSQLSPSGADSEFYYYGPPHFMCSFTQWLNKLGVSRDQRHFEFFGPQMSTTSH